MNKTKLLEIAQALDLGSIDDKKARKLLLGLLGVGGSASQFEEDTFKLINAYVNEGLSKPDLVRKMKWITGSFVVGRLTSLFNSCYAVSCPPKLPVMYNSSGGNSKRVTVPRHQTYFEKLNYKFTLNPAIDYALC
jgi:hypothetical protein